MDRLEEFVKAVKAAFPDDRLTYQKTIPTFHPETAEEAAAFMRIANSLRQKLYITGFGNIIDPVGDRFARLAVIRTDRLNKLLECSATGLFVRIGSGFPLMEINHELAVHGLFMPHSRLPYVGSVGGAVAVNLSADLHGADVPLRRFILQAEVVTGVGQILTAGSPNARVAGGQDIARMFAPSWGQLGLIVTVTFRVMPVSAEADYAAMRMKKVDRAGHAVGGQAPRDHDYFRKIKSRFDPGDILAVP